MTLSEHVAASINPASYLHASCVLTIQRTLFFGVFAGAIHFYFILHN